MATINGYSILIGICLPVAKQKGHIGYFVVSFSEYFLNNISNLIIMKRFSIDINTFLNNPWLKITQ